MEPFLVCINCQDLVHHTSYNCPYKITSCESFGEKGHRRLLCPKMSSVAKDPIVKPTKRSQEDGSLGDLGSNPAKVSRGADNNEDSGCIDGLEDDSIHDLSQTETDLSIFLSNEEDNYFDEDGSGRNQENRNQFFPRNPQEQSTPCSNTSLISSASMGSSSSPHVKFHFKKIQTTSSRSSI